MHRIYLLMVLGGIMIAVLTKIGPASADLAKFRMPGCRSYLNEENALRYDYTGGVCFGNVEAFMSVAATLSICPPPESSVDQGIRLVVRYVSSQPDGLNKDFSAIAIEALRKAWPCSGSQKKLPTRN
jgi:Rap1a immunity proteins